MGWTLSSGDSRKNRGEPQSIQVEDWEVSFAELNLSDGLKGLYTHRIQMYGIFPYIWLIFMLNVGTYTSPMDAMGYINIYTLLETNIFAAENGWKRTTFLCPFWGGWLSGRCDSVSFRQGNKGILTEFLTLD